MEPKQKKRLAQHLRRNMSLPEVLLWKRIQNDQLGYRIRRQVEMGGFVADFYCANPKLAIEVDGKDHQFRQRHDESRDQWFNSQGISVLRISARSVLKNPEVAASEIKLELDRLASEDQTKDASSEGRMNEVNRESRQAKPD